MDKENMYIEDDSGDKKYFTMLPNYILNHSTAVDQALYCQLKKFAGENGVAYPSATTLMKKLGVSRNTIKKSIAYLLKRGWIKTNGKREIKTAGGTQFVVAYKIVDIWKINIEHYEDTKGCQNSIALTKGVSQGGVNRGCQNSATIENHIEEEPYKEDTEIALTNPKDITSNFFNMVLKEPKKFDEYVHQLGIPEALAKLEIKKFTEYWTELNPTGKKQRWQLEKTFEIQRRLKTWFSRVKGFNPNITNKYQVEKV